MKQYSKQSKSDQLRRHAEELVANKKSLSLNEIRDMSLEEIQQALHKLHVHQLELELQNQELRQTQCRLEESEDRYFELFDLAPVGYIVVSLKGLIVEANLAAANMLGLTRDKLVRQPFSRFIHSKDQDIYYLHRKELFRARSLDARQKCELRVVKADGSAFWVFLEAAAIENESGSIVCRVIMNDINERVQAREEVDRVNARLQKAVTERDKLFSIIAHDLKSPFIGFLTFIRMLTENIDNFSVEEIQKLAREMKHSAVSLYSLLENLLEWSLVQRGLNDYQPVSCHLADVVRENIDLFRTLAQNKDISIRCEVPDSLDIYVDKPMMKMVLRNLISNAVKFSKSSGTVKISAESKEGSVRVSVADEGIGMDRVTLEKLFILGQVSSRTGTDGEKGTGLGLILCQEYVHRHGGEIWAHSVPDKGTTFHFTLPPSPLRAP